MRALVLALRWWYRAHWQGRMSVVDWSMVLLAITGMVIICAAIVYPVLVIRAQTGP